VSAYPELAPVLADGLDTLGLDPTALTDPLLDYLALLVKWNRAYNLTAIREPREMVVKHLLDSLAIHRFVDGGSLADIGTGPGLPGIPLALAHPALHVSLVETAGKKARFLREAVRVLGLTSRVTVHAARAEQVAESGRHDCLVARALGTLAMIIEVGGHLLRPGGRLLAMKGRFPDDELAALPPGWRHLSTHLLAVPGLDAERHLVIIERAG
jgi:16S rRNA (guanine527-N7)-methyltransferase